MYPDGRARKRLFSVAKYGERKALAMARKARAELVQGKMEMATQLRSGGKLRALTH